MLSFVQKFMTPKANPIGVDFGSDSLRMAQVRWEHGQIQLVAAAAIDVPSHVRHDPAGRVQFFVEATRELLSHGHFVGRRAILSLPVAHMFIQHLRVPKMDAEALAKALPWEARGKLPIDPSQAVLRHLVAGEVYVEHEPKNEVIVLAASREMVEQYLRAAQKAKLDVVGMNVEMSAVVDCFNHIYRRKTDETTTNCFVDIGCSASRAIISRGDQVLFARSIPVGGDHFNRATADALKMALHEARSLRAQLAMCQPAGAPVGAAAPAPALPAPAAVAPAGDENNSFALLGAALSAAGQSAPAPTDERRQDLRGGDADAPAEPERRYADALPPGVPEDMAEKMARVEQACREPLGRLVEELTLCRRYHEATFPSRPIDRLVFIGGEARHRWLCQQIAREMSLPAQVGDPVARLGKNCQVPPESGFDRRQPQPNWAVAIGLSAGSAAGAAGNRGSAGGGPPGAASSAAA